MFTTQWLGLTEDHDEEEEEEVKKGYRPISSINIEWPALVVMAGKSRSGKTVFVKELIRQNRSHFDRIIVFSGSADLNPEYRDICDVKNCIDPSNYSKLNRVLALQEKLVRQGKKHRLLLIVDNIIGMANVHNGKIGKIFDRLSTQGRHMLVSTIFLTQKCTGVSPVVRQNAMYWLLTRLDRAQIQDTMFGFQDRFSNKYAWYKWYNKITMGERYSGVWLNREDAYDDQDNGCSAIAPVRIQS